MSHPHGILVLNTPGGNALHQHFLLTAAARTLSVREVFELSDEQAFNLFRQLRWSLGKEVVCPECGVAECHWFLPSRPHWRCKACGQNFSVTSGTIFSHHKLPLRVYLGAVALYTNAVRALCPADGSRPGGAIQNGLRVDAVELSLYAGKQQ